MKKFLIFIVSLFLFCFCFVFTTFASPKNGWAYEQNRWLYYENNVATTGWRNNIPGYSGDWFYFDDNGNMATGWKNDIPGYADSWFNFRSDGVMNTGWLYDDCQWYYLDSSGVMKTGWQQISYTSDSDWFYFHGSGSMATGWLKLDAWYYFKNNGVMCYDCVTPDGYYVDKNGRYYDNSKEQYMNRILELVNKERNAVGVSSLKLSTSLNTMAQKRAEEASVNFSHTRPNGQSWTTIFDDYSLSFKYSGENLAAGQREPEEVVEAWMKSTEHRKNILNPDFQYMGVGYYCKSNSEYQIYWSQLFYTPMT